MELEKDNEGNIITRPITEWAIGPAGGVAVLLAVRYAERPEELESGSKQVQLVLMPEQALELAETLTRHAHRVLQTPTTERPC